MHASRQLILTLGAFALLTALFAFAGPPRDHVPAYLVVFAVSAALYLVACRLVGRALAGWNVGRVALFLVLTGAALRLGAVAAPTSLSDDVYRYVWDGELTLSGHNPYRASPKAWHLQGVGDPETFDALNSPGFISLYPPIAQAVFATGALAGRLPNVTADRATRLLLGLFDLVAVALLTLLLARLRRPPWQAALYAWNPLVVWELVGGGHSEAVLMPLLVACLLAAVARRPILLGLAIGAAALAKLTVLALAPVLGWYILRRRGVVAAVLATAAAVAALVVGYAPFWFDGLVANLRSSLALYYGYFIFNSPLFDLSRWLLGYQEGVTPDVSHLVVPAFQITLIAVLAVAAVAVNGRPHRLAAGVTVVAVAQLVLTPVFHPWYLVPALLLAVVARMWAPILLSILVVVTYLAYTPDASGRVPVWAVALQFIPFLVLVGVDVFRALLAPIMTRRARRKYGDVAPLLAGPCDVLDIGAGEGFVGREATRHGHRVHLVDVVDHNQTDLPHRLYDGRRLPFDDDAFDAGLLSYVLHHCDDPRAVLEEASRTCTRLMVMESVYETPFDRRLLTFLDHLANWFRGIPIEPLRFDTVDGWRQTFAELGLQVVSQRRLGWFVHKHVLFEVARRGEQE